MEVRSFDTQSSVSHYQRMNLIEMNELDVPSDPCYTGLNSNFHECVKYKVANKVLNYLKFSFLHLLVSSTMMTLKLAKHSYVISLRLVVAASGIHKVSANAKAVNNQTNSWIIEQKMRA